MTKEELIQIIKDKGFDKNGNFSSAAFSRSVYLKSLIPYIIELTPNCKTDVISERCYWILNDVNDYPKSCVCGKPITAFYFNKGYFRDYCCVSCAVIATTKRGKDHHLASDESKAQIKESVRNKYGVDHIQQVEKIADARKQTCQEKYGSPSFLGSKVGREVIQKSLIDNLGVTNISQAPEVQSQIKKTRIDNFYPGKEKWLIENGITPLFAIDDYVNNEKIYPFKCNTCSHEFESHLLIGAVPKCFVCNPSSDGRIYLARFQSEVEDFLKIGITIQDTAKDRLRNIRVYNLKEVLVEKELKINEARILEREILNLVFEKGMQYLPWSRFAGETECIKLEFLDKVLELLK